MRKQHVTRRHSQKAKAEELLLRADEQWNHNRLRSAFRLFLAAAKAGDMRAQTNLGYFYDKGIGIRPRRKAALYWYNRAYRRGDGCAAHNIGTIWRDEQNQGQALAWFQRAVKLGEEDSNLEIAKLYLCNSDPDKAISYLNLVLNSRRVAKVDVEEAKRLVKQAKRERKRC